MTTEAAAELYLAQHKYQHKGRAVAIHNPNSLPVNELPVIYGFNNGGSPGWMSAVLIAEDGECLGGHTCSHEGYMPADLGVLDGTRQDRHETFRKHYPNGYRMEFVPSDALDGHDGFQAALAKVKEKK